MEEKPLGLGGGEDQGRRPAPGADHQVVHPGVGEALEHQARPGQVDVWRGHATIPSARRMERCFTEVSAYSAAGSDAATIPAPA